ncbi:hypothetical protein GCM10022381_23040 [Leifsonia kafniensis]|uniref:DUF202 domain-containing protein n=1 Tax=Leifsonia kafniensis TaxID=475957 RepID=A0ABP7KMD8_9MICO
MNASPGPDRVFDQGLQPERTFLAWQRTVLALGVACAVAVRFTAPHFGPVAIVAGIGGVGLALAAYIAVRYRYRRTHTALTQSARPEAEAETVTDALHSVSAWPIAAVAASTLLLGVLAVFFLWGGIQL